MPQYFPFLAQIRQPGSRSRQLRHAAIQNESQNTAGKDQAGSAFDEPDDNKANQQGRNPTIAKHGCGRLQRRPHHTLHSFGEQRVERPFDHKEQPYRRNKISHRLPVGYQFFFWMPSILPKYLKKSLFGDSTIVVPSSTRCFVYSVSDL